MVSSRILTKNERDKSAYNIIKVNTFTLVFYTEMISMRHLISKAQKLVEVWADEGLFLILSCLSPLHVLIILTVVSSCQKGGLR